MYASILKLIPNSEAIQFYKNKYLGENRWLSMRYMLSIHLYYITWENLRTTMIPLVCQTLLGCCSCLFYLLVFLFVCLAVLFKKTKDQTCHIFTSIWSCMLIELDMNLLYNYSVPYSCSTFINSFNLGTRTVRNNY